MTAHHPGDWPLVGIALLDEEGRIRSHDAALAEMLGPQLRGTKLSEAVHLEAALQERLGLLMSQVLDGRETPAEPVHWQSDGTEYQLRLTAVACASEPPRAVALLHALTPYEHDGHLRTLRSLHTFHEAMVRLLTEPDAQTLMRAVSRVLVKSGGYPLVWIGCISEGRIGRLDSSADPDGYLQEVETLHGADGLLDGPVRQALDTGRPAICREGDPAMPHPKLSEVYGYRSVAAFPIIIEGEGRAVMTVYSPRLLAFRDGEYDTLDYIAEGVAYGLARLGQRHEQQMTEDKLRQTTTLFEASREGQLVTDEQLRIIAINPALSDLTGYSEAELLGREPSLFRSGRHEGAYYEGIWSDIEARGFWQGEIWNRCKDGTIKPFWLRIVKVPPTVGAPARYVGSYTDIAALKETEARLEHLAHHDALTDLPNRALLESRLGQAMNRASRHGGLVAILFLDLDGFKRINDSYGHGAGDRVLLTITDRLRNVTRQEDTLARFGGDEFVILVENLRQPEQASIIARQLLKAVDRELELDGQPLNLSASIGIAVAPAHGEDPHELIQNADTAMYRAKTSGPNTYQYYTRDLTMRTRRQLTLENLLRSALERGEFQLHYQPLIDIASGRITAVEALLRWNRSTGEPVSPEEFVPLAEERGLIVPIGNWVLEEACQQAVAWASGDIGPLRVAVNVSGRQLDQRGFARRIDDLLLQYQLRPDLLELEITETLLMEHDTTSGIFDYLGQLGLRLAIDDFGTGYSSLSRLTQLHPDTIKIDRSFVQAAPQQTDAAAITTAIIHMAHTLDMEVVAEGVETRDQLDFLRSRAVDLLQGYYFTAPLPVGELEAWIRRYREKPGPSTDPAQA